MDREAVLAAFEEQMRMSVCAPGFRARVEQVGPVVRCVAATADGWSGVIGARLDEGSADAAIAEQIRHFAQMGRTFEWKYYAHDRPLDLPRRLVAAGFEAGPEEALMVAEVAGLDTDVAPPPGVRLVSITDEAGVALLKRVHEEVFGGDHAGRCNTLIAQLAEAPDTVAAVVAMVGDAAVSSARIELHPGSAFASLWGGSTLPAFRRRGIYRALVAHRARIAAARGFRYLQVDALPTSRPILERLGFVELSKTIPYTLRPMRASITPRG